MNQSSKGVALGNYGTYHANGKCFSACFVYSYEGWSCRAGARAGCGDEIEEVIFSRRRDAKEKGPVKCPNVQKVILCYIIIILIFAYCVCVSVFSGQLVVMPKGLLSSAFE
jgi:hypothetical protein